MDLRQLATRFALKERAIEDRRSMLGTSDVESASAVPPPRWAVVMVKRSAVLGSIHPATGSDCIRCHFERWSSRKKSAAGIE